MPHFAFSKNGLLIDPSPEEEGRIVQEIEKTFHVQLMIFLFAFLLVLCPSFVAKGTLTKTSETKRSCCLGLKNEPNVSEVLTQLMETHSFEAAQTDCLFRTPLLQLRLSL